MPSIAEMSDVEIAQQLQHTVTTEAFQQWTQDFIFEPQSDIILDQVEKGWGGEGLELLLGSSELVKSFDKVFKSFTVETEQQAFVKDALIEYISCSLPVFHFYLLALMKAQAAK